MKKGFIHLDWAVAMALFITAIAVLMFYVRYFMYEEQPFSELMNNALVTLNENLEKIAAEEVKVYHFNSYPEIQVSYYPFYFEIKNQSLIAVVNSEQSFPLAFDPSKNSFRALISTNKEAFVVESNNLSTYCPSDVWINNFALGNENMNLTYNATHLLSVEFNSTEFLSKPAELWTSSIVERSIDCTQSMIVFDKLNISVDSFSKRVWFSSLEPSNYTFLLPNFLTHVYINENEYSLASVQQLNQLSNLTSLYNQTLGISFIGNSINISIVNHTNEINVTLFDVKEFEILLHEGNYTLALNESKVFNRTFVKLKPALVLKPLFNQSLSTLQSKTYEQQKELLGIEGLDFNLTISNITLGTKEPLYANIFVRRLPTLFLENNGVVKAIEMVLLVW
jgi:hypothetical protein